MRYFTFGEAWGPFDCEHPDCKEETNTIRLTDEENELLPEQTGPRVANFILENGLGIVVCKKHEKYLLGEEEENGS